MTATTFLLIVVLFVIYLGLSLLKDMLAMRINTRYAMRVQKEQLETMFADEDDLDEHASSAPGMTFYNN